MKFSLLLLLLSSPMFGQTTTDLLPHIKMFSGYGGNIINVATPEGNILIDSGTAKGAQTIIKMVPKVSYLLSTHRHQDHVGGNNYYGRQGAKIIAQNKTAQYIKEKNSGVSKEGYATITFDKKYSLKFGGEELELIYFPNAHTDGDYVVYFPKHNLIHMADISFGTNYNYLDTKYGATIGGLINATEQIVKMVDDETVIVPGHGEILTKDQLRQNLIMYIEIRDAVKILKDQGKTLAETIAAKPSKKYDRRGEWSFITAEKFVTAVYKTVK